MKKLKTITLGSNDNPGTVTCPGHVTAKQFNDAFKNEGWSERGEYKQKDLRYGYMKKRPTKNGAVYTQVPPDHPQAKKFTWTSWD